MKVSDLTNTLQMENQNNKVSQKTKDAKLWKASQEMEGVFISILVKAMEKTIPEGSLTGSENNSLSKMMFSTVMGKEVAKNGGMGLAKQIYNSMEENGDEALKKLQSIDYTQYLQNLTLPEVNNDD